MKTHVLGNIIVLLCVFRSFDASAQSNADLEAIDQVLKRQVRAWNDGDVEAFMEGYWESEQLKFIGKNGVVKGYEATLARYKRNYPDKAAMGTLTFDILSKEKLSRKVAFVVGKWHLSRGEVGDLEGHFSLLWKKIKGEWVIVADHSS